MSECASVYIIKESKNTFLAAVLYGCIWLECIRWRRVHIKYLWTDIIWECHPSVHCITEVEGHFFIKLRNIWSFHVMMSSGTVLILLMECLLQTAGPLRLTFVHRKHEI